MGHTFLSLDMLLIPQSTKDNVPSFWSGLFSSDGTRMLIDGYNDNREMVHSKNALLSWLQWSEKPLDVLDELLATSIEYTVEEISSQKVNVNSVWYERSGV